MSFGGLLTSAIAAFLSTQAQTQESSVVWEIESSHGKETVLARQDDYLLGVQFRCEGKPPSFRITFPWPEELATPPPDFEGALAGTVHIPPGPIRRAEWLVDGWLSTPLARAEIESLAESEGAVDIEVQAPDGEVFRRGLESNGIEPAVRRFFEYCEHHVTSADRKFQVDGIEVDLQIEVDEKGIEDIRALAAEFGILDVQKIYVGLRGIPVSQLVALVESRAARDGDKIAQSQLTLRQKYWKYWESSDPDPEADLTRRGLWQARPRDLHVLDRWIVRDGDWSIEVGLGEGVPYDDAVRIIRAIRAGSLVDVREGPQSISLFEGPYELKQWSAYALPRIARDKTAPAGESGRYEISIPSRGSGTILHVRIVGDRVEVVGVSIWRV